MHSPGWNKIIGFSNKISETMPSLSTALMIIKTLYIALSSALLIMITTVLWIGYDLSQMPTKSITIVGSPDSFTGMEARTVPQQVIGLSLRSDFSTKDGMIFLYPTELFRTFSMAYTSINLDILFINKNRQIFQIERNVRAFTKTPITSSAPAQYVLELKAGKGALLSPGDVISF